MLSDPIVHIWCSIAAKSVFNSSPDAMVSIIIGWRPRNVKQKVIQFIMSSEIKIKHYNITLPAVRIHLKHAF